jgi:hypothetical protein
MILLADTGIQPWTNNVKRENNFFLRIFSGIFFVVKFVHLPMMVEFFDTSLTFCTMPTSNWLLFNCLNCYQYKMKYNFVRLFKINYFQFADITEAESQLGICARLMRRLVSIRFIR